MIYVRTDVVLPHVNVYDISCYRIYITPVTWSGILYENNSKIFVKYICGRIYKKYILYAYLHLY